MDWTGFMLFVMLYIEFSNLRASLLDTSCNGGAYMCTQMGFHDDWQQYKFTSNIKFYLSVRSIATLAHSPLSLSWLSQRKPKYVWLHADRSAQRCSGSS